MSPKDDPKKIYLGDGVYADHDGFQIRLTTSDGIRETNEIFLEHSVIALLQAYIHVFKETTGGEE